METEIANALTQFRLTIIFKYENFVCVCNLLSRPQRLHIIHLTKLQISSIRYDSISGYAQMHSFWGGARRVGGGIIFQNPNT